MSRNEFGQRWVSTRFEIRGNLTKTVGDYSFGSVATRGPFAAKASCLHEAKPGALRRLRTREGESDHREPVVVEAGEPYDRNVPKIVGLVVFERRANQGSSHFSDSLGDPGGDGLCVPVLPPRRIGWHGRKLLELGREFLQGALGPVVELVHLSPPA